MLTSLAIRDIVLIERLDLELASGLCVLTGETGAGKSILLDALGLALGGRAERNLVRRGARQGAVAATFTLERAEDVRGLLDAHGLELEDPLVLRRVVGADGRSRAYVNDQPVGSGLLRRIGELLVEVHGQQEQQALLDPGTQRRLLDSYGRLEPQATALRAAYQAWRAAEARRAELAAEAERLAADEAYWRHVLDELDRLAPAADEEDALAEARARLMNREKVAQAIRDALDLVLGQGGVEARLGGAGRSVERVLAASGGRLDDAVQALERARVEAGEAVAALEAAARALELESDRLEQIEERLFALRAAARKHQVTVAELPQLRADTSARLAGIDAGGTRLAEASAAERAARAGFVEQATRLSAARAEAAAALERAVTAELPPLRLDKARLVVRLEALAEDQWSGEGAERIAFEVATNPGQAPGPLARIASGGELARLMLALKVVLARGGSVPCLIFDEVDTGIGGATADAVGERLARLGETLQVLVVTHAPQVAARADHHWRVAKATTRNRARVAVDALAEGERREEIARMLAGATVTEAARAAADSLIAGSA